MLPKSVFEKKNGCKAKPSCSSNEVEQTVETCEDIKSDILPYSDLGIKFQAINVFWCKVASSTHKAQPDDDPSTHDDDLQAARPPDGVVLPIWRLCHMGIILEGYNSSTESNSAKLYLAIELFRDGIHMKHSFGKKSKKRVIQMLRGNLEGDVYSGGVKRDIDIDLKILLEVVESFKKSSYNLASFNCQQFTTILFWKFTGQLLGDGLRRRWTSNHNGWGFPTKSESADEAMDWACKSNLLMEELKPVEGEQFLFSRSPPAVGGATKGALAGGAAVAVRVNPLLGVGIAAGAFVVDKIPRIRRFARSTFWYKYDKESKEWFWTPYRDQEIAEHMRWISIHQSEVEHGEFKGKVIQKTNKRIVSVLANNTFDPTENDKEMCNICLRAKPASCFTQGLNCPQEHGMCSVCFAKVGDRCPFCRTSLVAI